MREDSQRYWFLRMLAQGDTPMTCEEVWNTMPDRARPVEADTDRPWGNLTSTAASLYGDHYVDRRKRDAKWKPMEYWLAAKGRELLAENGHLPDDRETPAGAVPENPDSATETTAEQPAPEPAVDLGLDDPEVDTARRLTDLLTDMKADIRELEGRVETVSETATDGGEAEQLRERLRTVTEQVNALASAHEADTTVDAGDFAPYIEYLHDLHEQGYGVYAAEQTTGHGGDTRGLSLTAKPREKTDHRGPSPASDGDERVTVVKDETADDTAAEGADGE
jgi:hypothetical protein